METLEQLQRALTATDSLRNLVKTMKALSAVSIHQYESALRASGDFSDSLELGLAAALRDKVPLPAPAGRDGSRAAIVFGSDLGLCGRLNEEIAELAVRHHGADRPRFCLAVGTLCVPHLEDAGWPVDAELLTAASAPAISSVVGRVLAQIDTWRRQHPALQVWLYHNRPRDGGYHGTATRLFPLDPERVQGWRDKPWPGRSLPLMTLDREQLLGGLLQQYFFLTLFRACTEALVSEHGNRLAAMQRAERNLGDRLDELRQRYRSRRQARITDELLDVVSGYAATGET